MLPYVFPGEGIMLEKLPKVIASTVVRSAYEGESHGGVYIVDLETEEVEQVLEYDLHTRWFVRGYYASYRGLVRYLNMRGYRGERTFGAPIPRLRIYDPNGDEGPAHSNTFHLNSVFYENGVLFVAGTRCAHLLALNDSKLSSYALIPYGTHNTRPFGEGIIMNDTRKDRVTYLDRSGNAISLPVKHYDERELLYS